MNEVFLLHGTKSEFLDIIEADGLDTRVCDRALFGSGSYFAESSTKADQYTGNERTEWISGGSTPANTVVTS